MTYKFSYDLIDAPLSEEGYSQCTKAKEALKNENVKLVLVSPLKRALQTAREIFKDHSSNPKIVVYPQIREMLESSCDVPGSLKDLRTEFKEMDFELMDQFKD